MITSYVVPPIPRGYAHSVKVEARPPVDGDPVAFPVGCTLLADVALYEGGPAIATLSTEAGSIERVSDDTIWLRFAAADTAPMTNNRVVFDLVRTDSAPDVWLDLTFELPVHQPLTSARDEG